MQDIFRHITYLLTKSDCVIIPGFGGFVLHSENATYSKNDHVFMPPSVVVGFNPELKHNDGLITESLMKSEGLDYQEASLIVEQFSENLQQELNNSGEITFPQIGKLSYSKEGKLNFTQTSDSPVNHSMFGLAGIYMPPISKLEKIQRKAKHQDTIYYPIVKQLTRITAVAAAVVLVFLLMSTPIKDVDTPSQYASIIDTRLHFAQEKPATVSAPEETKEPEADKNEVPKAEPEKKEIKQVPEVAPTKAKNSETASTQGYYIIAASFTTSEEAKAKIQLSELKKLDANASLLKKDGRIRIYVAKFDNKKEADSYLNNFRKHYPKYESAWLLSSK